MRHFLLIGLVLLAVFMPLVALPVGIFVLVVALTAIATFHIASHRVPRAAHSRAISSRAPPPPH